MNVPYIPGTTHTPVLPLGRFLPPIPRGMVTTWCRNNLEPGEFVLEPFGFSPLVPIEITSAGHPVLVTVNNPIHAFILKILASAPQQEEFIAALQDLAVAPVGDERMEPYIRSLYYVNCAGCRRQIEAEAFLWEKGASQPFSAEIDCPFCGASGEQTLTEELRASLAKLPPKQMHHARALNRIVGPADPLRAQVENALNAYPIRPIIILQTIINKLDSLEQTPRRRDLLTAMILSAADQGNTLWAHPTPRSRPRQIVVPSTYRERNLWKVLEESINTWQMLDTPIPILDWEGEIPKTNGIVLFKGRIKELDPPIENGMVSAILTAIPRPNQAFWTLSALWTGWIWGQEAVSPIRQVLSRQRYDWNWHTNALSGIFETIQNIYHADLKFWGLISENEPMLLLATLLAGNIAGFQLTGFAQSLDDQLAQCCWTSGLNANTRTKPEQAMEIAREKAVNYLQQKGEPASFSQLHAATVTGLAAEQNLAVNVLMQNRNQATSETQKWIESIFQMKRPLTQIDDRKASVETGNWWLANPAGIAPPLIDRVEEQIVRHLVAVQTTTAETVKKVVYEAFPGIFTPEDEDLLNCLESYADLIDIKNHCWQLRETEHPAARKEDIVLIVNALKKIAHQLGYRITDQEPSLWFENSNPFPMYSFWVFSSAIISKHLQQSHFNAQTNIMVLPGSRLNLLAFKKQRDPILRQMLDKKFLMVKFRLIKDLVANPLLSRDLFNEQINAAPPEYQSSQLALF